MTKLKIAQIVNIWQSIPPDGYGGTERVVADLCSGLGRRGHHITLYASGDSNADVHLKYFFAKKLLHKNIPWSNYLYSLTHFLKSFEDIKRQGDFDIIHGHYSVASDLISVSFAHLFDIPSVFTLHTVLPVSDKQKDRRILMEGADKLNYISISNSQRQIPLNFLATIYHGINLDDFGFSDGARDNHMMWLGRIVPEKGLESCFEVANRLSKKLLVVGRVDKESKLSLSYFEDNIKEKLEDKNITYIEEADSKRRNELLTKSKLLLFPIQWEEPFGLVMIEAMACGTPVIAFARGSVPEVIVDGVTGFIVNSSNEDIRGDWAVKKTGIEGLVEAVERIYKMPEEVYRKMRRAARAHVEEKFTLQKMVEGYETIYKQILGHTKE